MILKTQPEQSPWVIWRVTLYEYVHGCLTVKVEWNTAGSGRLTILQKRWPTYQRATASARERYIIISYGLAGPAEDQSAADSINVVTYTPESASILFGIPVQLVS